VIPQYPDIVIPPRDRVNEWDLSLTVRGIPVDLRELSLDAYIFNDGKEVGPLSIVERDFWEARIRFRLSTAMLSQLRRYNTWRLYERSWVAGEIMRGRIIAPYPFETAAGLDGDQTWGQFNAQTWSEFEILLWDQWS
jgi:hypothetical protein